MTQTQGFTIKSTPKRCKNAEVKCSYLLEGVNWLLDDPLAYYAKRNNAEMILEAKRYAKKEKPC